MGSPAGRPSTIATSARPCDSPAVVKRNIVGQLSVVSGQWSVVSCRILALPRRCAASLRFAGNCLPIAAVSDRTRTVGDRAQIAHVRQVTDLPPGGVAKP